MKGGRGSAAESLRAAGLRAVAARQSAAAKWAPLDSERVLAGANEAPVALRRRTRWPGNGGARVARPEGLHRRVASWRHLAAS